VLDASHLAIRGRPDGSRQELLVGWDAAGAEAWDQRLGPGSGTVRTALSTHLPRRLGDTLLAETGVPEDTPLAQLRREQRLALVEAVTAYPLPWTGDEGYKKAEVTGGGVSLAEVVPLTMETRKHPGLFLCGEVLDAFGPIGGHNFMWAWSTGRTAGDGGGGASAGALSGRSPSRPSRLNPGRGPHHERTGARMDQPM
jgi:predicted flavoprotein YhiN